MSLIFKDKRSRDFQRQPVKRFSKTTGQEIFKDKRSRDFQRQTVKRFSNKGKTQKQHQHKHKNETRQDVKISYEFHRVIQGVLDSLVAFVPYMALIVKSKSQCYNYMVT